MSDKKYQPFQTMASRKEKKGKQKRNEYRKSDKTEQVLRQLEMMVSQFGVRRVHRVYGEVLRISISSYKHMDEIADALTQLLVRKDIDIESISFPSSGTVNNKRGFVIYMKTVHNRKSEHVLLLHGYHVGIVTTFEDPGVQTQASPTQLVKMKMESLKELAKEIPLPTRVAPVMPKTPLEPTKVPMKRWSDAVKSNRMSPKSKSMQLQRPYSPNFNRRGSYKNVPLRRPNHFAEQIPAIDGNFAYPPRNFYDTFEPSYDYPDYRNMQREVRPFSEQAWRPPSPPKARLRPHESNYPTKQQLKDALPSVQMPEKFKKQKRKSLPWRPSWKIARMQNETTYSLRKTTKGPGAPPGFELAKKQKPKTGNSKQKQYSSIASPPTSETQPSEMNIVDDVKQSESSGNHSLSMKASCASNTDKEIYIEQPHDTPAIEKSDTDESSEYSVTGMTHTSDTDEIERSRSVRGSSSDKDASSNDASELQNSSTGAIAAAKEILEVVNAGSTTVSPNADAVPVPRSWDSYLIISLLNTIMGFILLVVAYRHSVNDSQLELEIIAGLVVCAFSCFMIVIPW